MAITSTLLVDTKVNVLMKGTGVGSEQEQVLINVSDLNEATNESILSINTLNYDIKGTGKVKILFQGDTNIEAIELSGRGQYGKRLNEPEILNEATNTNGNILLTSDSNVTSYVVLIEANKKDGFNG